MGRHCEIWAPRIKELRLHKRVCGRGRLLQLFFGSGHRRASGGCGLFGWPGAGWRAKGSTGISIGSISTRSLQFNDSTVPTEQMRGGGWRRSTEKESCEGSGGHLILSASRVIGRRAESETGHLDPIDRPRCSLACDGAIMSLHFSRETY